MHFRCPNKLTMATVCTYYNAGYSAPSSIDTTSIRVDHSFGEKFKVFGRYSDSPSDSTARQPSDLAQVNATIRNVKTVTLGVTSAFSPAKVNDFRFNVTATITNRPAISITSAERHRSTLPRFRSAVE